MSFTSIILNILNTWIVIIFYFFDRCKLFGHHNLVCGNGIRFCCSLSLCKSRRRSYDKVSSMLVYFLLVTAANRTSARLCTSNISLFMISPLSNVMTITTWRVPTILASIECCIILRLLFSFLHIRSLAFEWAKYGMRMNIIAPGPFETEVCMFVCLFVFRRFRLVGRKY